MSEQIKKCRFVNCKHPSRDIHLDTEDYVVQGHCYYHADCFDLKKSGEWKSQKTKEDLQKFRDLWHEKISKTTDYRRLMSILNQYIANGVESEYLLFALQYVIDNGYNLNYPNGFKYYVDRVEIKDAYQKQLLKRSKKDNSFQLKEDNSPTFSAQVKTVKFTDIFKSNKK